MRIDPGFCMSSYLQYRTVVDPDCRFSENLSPRHYEPEMDRTPVNSAEELDVQLRDQVQQALSQGTCALMLSSGMDSAILATYLPKGTLAYTLHCRSDQGIDERQAAALYAEMNGLDHRIVDITWRDYEEWSLPLMRKKGYPIHSIEVQVLQAARQAKADGVDTLIFGETADIIYGGHSMLLSRDWRKSEFVERFSFVDPRKVLKKPMWIDGPAEPYVGADGNVDVHGFLNGFEYPVSLGFYHNACRLGGVHCCTPYAHTRLGHVLDLDRIRAGEGKYLVRQLFSQLYPGVEIPPKTPLPRPMGEWLGSWSGPEHPAFLSNCIGDLSGDQRWYVYALDQFLRNIMEA